MDRWLEKRSNHADTQNESTLRSLLTHRPPRWALSGIVLPPKRRTKINSSHPPKVWEPDQGRIFLGRRAPHRLGALFEVAILTGLRRGEITGLRWSDVNLAKRTIVVRRNRVSVRGRVVEQQTTKTKSGLRTVTLSDFAGAMLLAWQLRQAEEAEAAQEAWQTQGHVFTMEDGCPPDPSYVTRLFQRPASDLVRSFQRSPSTASGTAPRR
jgi:integrase